MKSNRRLQQSTERKKGELDCRVPIDAGMMRQYIRIPVSDGLSDGSFLNANARYTEAGRTWMIADGPPRIVGVAPAVRARTGWVDSFRGILGDRRCAGNVKRSRRGTTTQLIVIASCRGVCWTRSTALMDGLINAVPGPECLGRRSACVK